MKTKNPLSEIALIENKPFSARKFAYAAFSLIFLLILSLQSLFAASYYSRQSGNWNDRNTWTADPSGSGSRVASVPSTGTHTFVVLGNRTVTISDDVSASSFTLSVQAGSTLNQDASNNKAFSIGTATISGTYIRASTSTFSITTLTVNSGGIYRHAVNSSIPTATWNSGSRCEITGVGSSALSGLNQTFSNLIWNCPSQSTNISFPSTGTITINDTLFIDSTGNSQVRLNQSTLNVGEFVQSGGSFAVASTARTMNVSALFKISGGTFDLSRGSSTGTLNVGGHFSFTGGTITETSSGRGAINFTGTSNQNIITGGTVSNDIRFTVNRNSIVDFSTHVLSGSGASFTAQSESTLKTANTGGFASSGSTGTIQVGSTRTFEDSLTIIYNGSSAQVTGTAITVYENLMAMNNAGVSLSANTSVLGMMHNDGLFKLNGFELTIIDTACGAGTMFGSSLSSIISNGTGELGCIRMDQSVPGSSNVLKNLTINRTSSGKVTLLNELRIVGVLDVEGSATLVTGGFLTIANGGSIADINGTISGNVKLEIQTAANRSWRMLGHPFSSAIALDQLTDNIDITGNASGTATAATPCDGCTATTSNAPSAYYYDTQNADTTYGTADPGWKSFNNMTTASWAKHQGIRILVRGAKGEGLDGSAYTPSATTLTMSGAVNDGEDQTITIYRAANAVHNIVSNPFCSPIDIGSLSPSRRGNLTNTYHVWDALSGSNFKGIYRAKNFGSSFIIPVGAAFIVHAVNNNVTFQIDESIKTSATAQTLYKGSEEQPFNISMSVGRDNRLWDQFSILFDDVNATEAYDNWDAKKMINPDFNIYSKSSDQVNLSIDSRKTPTGTELIPLTMVKVTEGTLKFDFTASNFPTNVSAYFIDAFTQTRVLITPTSVFEVAITADAASKNANRFSIELNKSTTGNNELVQNSTPAIQVYPVPANNELNVIISGASQGKATYTVSSLSGATVQQGLLDFTGSNQGNIQIENLPTGIYFLQVENDKFSKVIRFTKN